MYVGAKARASEVNMKRYLSNLILGLLVTSGMAVAQVAENETFVVPLSRPGSPAILAAEILQGTIKVTGYEGNEVLVDVRFASDHDEEGDHEASHGLMRIPSVSGGLTIEEDQNQVTIETDWSQDEINLEVRVPFQTSVRLSGVNGEWIEVDGVSGQHELSQTNGDIRATGIRGSIVADSTNGDITVELVEVTPDVPMSFSTFNGDIDLRLPAETSADLRLQSGQGDIYTDFEVVTKPTQTRVDPRKQDKGFRVRIEREVLGTIGAGGPELRFKTVNGDIYLRKIQ